MIKPLGWVYSPVAVAENAAALRQVCRATLLMLSA